MDGASVGSAEDAKVSVNSSRQSVSRKARLRGAVACGANPCLVGAWVAWRAGCLTCALPFVCRRRRHCCCCLYLLSDLHFFGNLAPLVVRGQHAKITFKLRKCQFVIKDLKSSNGTYMLRPDGTITKLKAKKVRRQFVGGAGARVEVKYDVSACEAPRQIPN